MDVRVHRIARQLREHSQVLRLEKLRRRHLDERVLAFQVPVEPPEHRHLQVLCVLVRPLGNQ